MIAVIGGDSANGEDERLAYEVGAEIGRRGHRLICGGGRGVMREACRGAREQGALTIGVLPGEDRAEMNAYVDVPIVTGLGFARNTIIVRSADGVVAIGGRYGTLSEIAFALICAKPLVGIGTWELAAPLGEPVPLVRCASAKDAIDYCERSAREE